ncbi:hypothetical protein SCB49_02124 [unidentified eubacterium SCB49]|nr:hypothetical protein SCB49_02124 [unidentified eubacterium SCB49]
MLSSGQILFSIFFVIVFITLIVISYRKDLKLHQKHYKKSYLILIGFLVFVGLLVAIKYALK